MIDLARMEVEFPDLHCAAVQCTLCTVQVVGRSEPRQRVFIPAELSEPAPLQVTFLARTGLHSLCR